MCFNIYPAYCLVKAPQSCSSVWHAMLIPYLILNIHMSAANCGFAQISRLAVLNWLNLWVWTILFRVHLVQRAIVWLHKLGNNFNPQKYYYWYLLGKKTLLMGFLDTCNKKKVWGKNAFRWMKVKTDLRSKLCCWSRSLYSERPSLHNHCYKPVRNQVCLTRLYTCGQLVLYNQATYLWEASSV